MRASGPAATLLAGYQTAVAIGAWEMVPGSNGVAFSAAITEQHPVWLSRRPLSLVVGVGRVEWTWRDVTPAIDGDRLVIVLTTLPAVTERHEATAAANRSGT